MSDEPQVSRVVDLVSYQADAIGSRIVLQTASRCRHRVSTPGRSSASTPRHTMRWCS